MRRFGAGLALVAALAGPAACGDSDGSGEGLDVAEIQAAFDDDEPGRVTGKEATLAGRVERLLSPSAFVIEEGDEPLLVVAKDKRTPGEGFQVRVTGTVHKFDVGEVRERLGSDTVEPWARKHMGEPYLWAKRVEVDEGG